LEWRDEPTTDLSARKDGDADIYGVDAVAVVQQSVIRLTAKVVVVAEAAGELTDKISLLEGEKVSCALCSWHWSGWPRRSPQSN
jgi:hypothetical protein